MDTEKPAMHSLQAFLRFPFANHPFSISLSVYPPLLLSRKSSSGDKIFLHPNFLFSVILVAIHKGASSECVHIQGVIILL